MFSIQGLSTILHQEFMQSWGVRITGAERLPRRDEYRESVCTNLRGGRALASWRHLRVLGKVRLGALAGPEWPLANNLAWLGQPGRLAWLPGWAVRAQNRSKIDLKYKDLVYNRHNPIADSASASKWVDFG